MKRLGDTQVIDGSFSIPENLSRFQRELSAVEAFGDMVLRQKWVCISMALGINDTRLPRRTPKELAVAFALLGATLCSRRTSKINE